MVIAIPNIDVLPVPVRVALEGMITTIVETFTHRHTADGVVVRQTLRAYHNTTQTLPTATWTPLTYNAEDDARGVAGVAVPDGVHSKTVRADRFIVPSTHAGLVRVRARVLFDINATGDRGVRLTVNGVAVAFGMVTAAAPTTSTVLTCVFDYVCAAADEIAIEAYQSSGGNLAVGNAARAFANEVQIEFP